MDSIYIRVSTGGNLKNSKSKAQIQDLLCTKRQSVAKFKEIQPLQQPTAIGIPSYCPGGGEKRHLGFQLSETVSATSQFKCGTHCDNM